MANCADNDDQPLLEVRKISIIEETLPCEDDNNEPAPSTKIAVVSVCLIFVRVQLAIVQCAQCCSLCTGSLLAAQILLLGCGLPSSRKA